MNKQTTNNLGWQLEVCAHWTLYEFPREGEAEEVLGRTGFLMNTRLGSVRTLIFMTLWTKQWEFRYLASSSQSGKLISLKASLVKQCSYPLSWKAMVQNSLLVALRETHLTWLIKPSLSQSFFTPRNSVFSEHLRTWWPCTRLPRTVWIYIRQSSVIINTTSSSLTNVPRWMKSCTATPPTHIPQHWCSARYFSKLVIHTCKI